MALYIVVHHSSDPYQPYANDWGGDTCKLGSFETTPKFVAAMNGIPYLLTWNCRHLANATMRPLIENVCAGKGLKAPIICTPEELLEGKR